MNTIDANGLLEQMRALATRAQGLGGVENAAAPAAGVDFKSMLKNAVDHVNETQLQARKLSEGFERGEPNIDIAEVMVSMQKANVSFQAITQVRNKLVSAYQDIMNMPI